MLFVVYDCYNHNMYMHTYTHILTHNMPTVPNIILAHEPTPTSDSSANILVTYADCVDDTSDFMAEVKYWRDGSDVVSLPLEPLSTSVFVLSVLMPGSVYWYEIRVENSSGAQIGESATGQFTAMRPPTFPPIATPTATPDTPADTGTCIYIWIHF